MSEVFDCSVDTALLTGMRLAKVALGRNQLAVIPTDTVYGLAADAFSPAGVYALLAAKGRGPQSPPPVLIPNVTTMHALAETVPKAALDLAEVFWPGALTLILKSQPSLSWDLGETKGTVALRMPDHKIALALLAETGPLAVSSANLTGSPAAVTCSEAKDYLGDKVAIYLDGGPSLKQVASTILDLTSLVEDDDDTESTVSGKIRIVRQGALSAKQIRAVVGDLLDEVQ